MQLSIDRTEEKYKFRDSIINAWISPSNEYITSLKDYYTRENKNIDDSKNSYLAEIKSLKRNNQSLDMSY